MGKLCGISEIKSLEDWKRIVGPDKWKKGKSAYELASSWLIKRGQFPPSLRKLFTQSEIPLFADLKLTYAIVESPVFLDSHKGPSMNDVLAYGESGKGQSSIVIAVEGKVDEAFDKPIHDWVRDGRQQPKPTRLKRLCFLNEQLQVDFEQDSRIGYQLLHRTASAIIEARKNGCDNAMLLIHSFESTKQGNFEDYSSFLSAYGINEPEKQKIFQVHLQPDPLTLYFLWFEDSKS